MRLPKGGRRGRERTESGACGALNAAYRDDGEIHVLGHLTKGFQDAEAARAVQA